MAFNPAAVKAFFQIAFGSKTQGFVCLAFRTFDPFKFQEKFYEWPAQLQQMISDVEVHHVTDDVYFCPQLLDGRRRKKENVTQCPTIWADLDECPPDRLLVAPTVLLESSPGRYQALWGLAEPADAAVGEDLSRRIAYYHSSHGADRSGWDLTQLLRVPGTYNYKYTDGTVEPPRVVSRVATIGKLAPTDFVDYPEVKTTKELLLPFPEQLPEMSAEDILQLHRNTLNPRAFGLLSTVPTTDWSGALWKLMMYCFEAGLERAEVYIVARDAKCNKYARDRRPPEHLWRDVCRAYLRHEEIHSTVVMKSEMEDLLTDQEIRDLAREDTFVERYVKWAKALGDAAVQYHHAGAFIVLSSLMSGNLRLPTSFGNLIPNIWFMILADTTLTRKTTAMDIAMDLLAEVDDDALLATDGSIEGLLTALAMRPSRASVFLRDEFTGLLEMMTKRDYYAGMGELLTKLYDGKHQKRVLRKETIEVKSPILVVFAGGIKVRTQSLLTFEHVSSGFLPRFVFVTAESDVTKVQPLGPPSVSDWGDRQLLQDELQALSDHYRQYQEQRSDVLTLPRAKIVNARLTPDAWRRYNAFEKLMLEEALQTDRADLMTPVNARLSISTLKAATLLAASRQKDEEVTVEESDICRALFYCREWRAYGADVINGIGLTSTEKVIQRVLAVIKAQPGIMRAKIMQSTHLTSREADNILGTLEDRGLVIGSRIGRRGASYHPVPGA